MERAGTDRKTSKKRDKKKVQRIDRGCRMANNAADMHDEYIYICILDSLQKQMAWDGKYWNNWLRNQYVRGVNSVQLLR